MLESIFAPYADWGLLILRVAVAIVFFAHGWPKLNPNGPMGGPKGFAGGLKQMGIPLPTFFAWLVALLETVGAVLLALGIGTRLLGILFAINMLVAIVKVKRANGQPFTGGSDVGWEFDFILLAAALCLLLTGPGPLALNFGF